MVAMKKGVVRDMVAKWVLVLVMEVAIWVAAEAYPQGHGSNPMDYILVSNLASSAPAVAAAAAAPSTTKRRSASVVPCRDQNKALTLVLDCVAGGSLQTHPSRRCCTGMKRLVSELSLSCMCQLLISVAGPSTPSLLRSYVTTCSIYVPPGFACKLA